MNAAYENPRRIPFLFRGILWGFFCVWGYVHTNYFFGLYIQMHKWDGIVKGLQVP